MTVFYDYVPIVTYKGEVPDQDVHENSQNQGPPASAPPPLSDMDNLQGYENTQFKNGEWATLFISVVWLKNIVGTNTEYINM